MNFEPDKIDLTILLSFPRSGSNFLQNIVKSNSEGIQCTSAYASGRFLRPSALLKSHAVGEPELHREMHETWKRSAARHGTIILIRDPRDIMISYYDFLQTVFADEVQTHTLFDFDFNWLRAEYRRRVKTDTSQHHSDRDNRDTLVYSVADAFKDWYSSWMRPARNPDWLYLKFEDLTGSPKQGFDSVFDYLSLSKPAEYEGLSTFVSQHGQSPRARGLAQGWRQAPAEYAPIIDQTNAMLGAETLDMGYD